MSVISFRKSVSELDSFAEQQTALQEALARCIQAAGQYAIELRREDAAALRANLERLSEQAAQSMDRASTERLQANVRGELRAYRDVAQKEAQDLKAEVSTTIESMQSFIATVTSTGSDHETALRREFQVLQTAADSGDLAAIRATVRKTIDAAMQSCEDIRRSRELIIAQLQDEIRSLHREVDHERRAAMEDPVTHLWNRTKIDGRIQDLILLNETFCVFLIGIRNLSTLGPGALTPQHPRLLPDCLRALAGRLQNLAGHSGEIGMTGRWSEDTFAIVFNLPLTGAPIPPKQVECALNGAYAIQFDGSTHTIKLDILVQAVERPKDSSEGTFFLNLGQTAFSVTAR